MNRITISILLLIGAILAHVGGLAQCPADTAIDGGFPPGEPQWSHGSGLFDECSHCLDFDLQNTWQLLDTGQVVFVWGGYFPPCDTVQVLITDNCSVVLSDTCLLLPLTGAGCIYEFEAHPASGNAQVLVYWRSQNIDSVGVLVASVNDGPLLDSALYSLDTCGMVYTTPAIPQQDCQNWLEIFSLKVYEGRERRSLPPGLYWNWCEDFHIGRKVLIFGD